MKYNLNGQVVVITGAARGIGYAIAEAFAKAEATVIIIDIAAELVDKAVSSLRAITDKAFGYAGNVVDGQGIEAMRAVPGRLEPVPNGIGAQVVVDYCHTPDALEKCLHTLNAIPHNRIITLFGCGGDRDRSKRPVMGGISLRFSDRVIVTSDNPRTEDPLAIVDEIVAGMKDGGDRYCVIPDRREAIRKGVEELQPGDILLLAGKGHETYQIVGREKHPFDDRLIAREYLIELGKGANA